MLKLRPRQSLFAMGALLALGLSSCGVSTVQQCNNFIEVINQGEEFQTEFEAEMEEFGSTFGSSTEIDGIKEMATSYIDVVGRVVEKINGMTSDLESLDLPDETLAGFRDRYAEVTAKLAQELANTSDAMAILQGVESEADLIPAAGEFQEKAFEAFTNIDTLSGDEDEITTGINDYCSAAAG